MGSVAAGEVEWEVDHAAPGGRSAPAGTAAFSLGGPKRGEDKTEGFGMGLPAVNARASIPGAMNRSPL